jgi:hypothetical protein
MHGKDFPSPPSRFLHEMRLASDRLVVPEPPVVEIPHDFPVSSVRPPRGDHGIRRPRAPFLTTGADLLNGSKNPVEFPVSFSVGMTVRHPQLGPGTVVAAQGTGKWRTVTVEFKAGEPVSFVVHKCPLQPIGAG